mmetsp:Transcript_17683/g.55360  ORF Transcript_17683/g.55360 Transcript_17683/m.55360 type:complete len:182 (+) Transcript_17683:1124-1669(+)
MIWKAAELDPTNAQALNQVANLMFWTWKKGPIAQVSLGQSSVLCVTDPYGDVCVGFDVRIGKSENEIGARVLSITHEPAIGWRIELSSPLRHPNRHDSLEGKTSLQLFCRNTPRVDELASIAYHKTAAPAARAESAFILGRNRQVNHDMLGALSFYAHACELEPKLVLARYRMAQTLAALG